MRTTVVTSFSPAGYEVYGRRFLEAFERYFSKDIDLVIYTEPGGAFCPPGDRSCTMRSLYHLPTFQKFHQRHKDSPLANGREATATWKTKDIEDGYCYRFDALKFCRKVFALADAAYNINDGLMVWLDADSFAHAPVPENFFADLLGTADVAYLGRDGTHSECGFLAFRLPVAVPLILHWENFYRRDAFLKQRESHDSYLFDRARELAPSVVCKNLTPGGKGHVWMHSPLAACMDHTKGKRKHLGFSPERRSNV